MSYVMSPTAPLDLTFVDLERSNSRIFRFGRPISHKGVKSVYISAKQKIGSHIMHMASLV